MALVVHRAEWKTFFDELRGESPRAMAILVAAYLDSLLERKLKLIFSRGESRTRGRLFGANGPFATSSAKVDALYCLGMLDPDVHHDLHILRRIRNKFAHQIHGLSMDSPEVRAMIDDLKTPHRSFVDWGDLQWAPLAKSDGIVLFSGEAPENADAAHPMPAEFWFRFGASVVMGYLAIDLDLALQAKPDENA